ncbi:hypothetical protein LLH06_04815 [Mucilaginibacter daejeonensis]|uniref:hypothetical protein n=1 Tax=Mucilaginibacter daejeonensis TaxID=398049 RepID=UPI001D174C9A|nr:hypothetical protein [Mucilaginibacter daejeonensis]UEG54288.1 hypothetical protein LLH06_04815 [Mucilaginibacter daejeonensis]
MKLRTYKLLVCLLFMMIFVAKMIISVAPVFLSLNNKTVAAVIMQLENENKNDKDDLEKEAAKEKKFFDEDIQHIYEPVLVLISIDNKLHIQFGHGIYQPGYHSTVPTPPPDVVLA